MNVTVSKVDECFMRVDCDDGLAKDLHDYFSFTVPNAKFMPSYKNKWWDPGSFFLLGSRYTKTVICKTMQNRQRQEARILIDG